MLTGDEDGRMVKGIWIVTLTLFIFGAGLPVGAENQPERPYFSTPSAMKGQCDTYPVKAMEPLHYGRLLVDRLEYSWTGKEKKAASYEVTGWYGGDYQRIWLEMEGEHDTGSSEGGNMERLDLLYGRLVDPFWNLRAGLGYKSDYGPGASERLFFVFGLKGLAPYMFEVDSNVRISFKGEVLLDLETEYDIYLTQRLVLQPRMDASFSFNRLKSMSIGPGFDNVSLGLRLRYEFLREFAPYVGISWSTRTGGSRDMARKKGAPRDVTTFMTGLRFWF